MNSVSLFGPGGALGPEVFDAVVPWMIAAASSCFFLAIALPIVWHIMDHFEQKRYWASEKKIRELRAKARAAREIADQSAIAATRGLNWTRS